MISKLATVTKLSPNHSGKRNHAVDRITPHCFVGQVTVERGLEVFLPTSKQASCQYVIAKDGAVGCGVDEENRSWCTSSSSNDHRAITIECASDTVEPYTMNSSVYNKLIDLCVDICQRYGKKKLIWIADKNQALAYEPKADEMQITVHRWFANKSCPGDWLFNRLGEVATTVTSRLNQGSGSSEPKEEPKNDVLYRVQVGAYSVKKNADNMLAKIKAAGYDTYMVQVDGLYKVQVGAYSKKSNAENMLAKIKADGFDAFITTKGGQAATVEAPKKKTVDEIAKEIYSGTCSDSRWDTWGNGATRVERLTAAGYDASAVQKAVNKLFS